jgi:hypothetical protein
LVAGGVVGRRWRWVAVWPKTNYIRRFRLHLREWAVVPDASSG